MTTFDVGGVGVSVVVPRQIVLPRPHGSPVGRRGAEQNAEPSLYPLTLEPTRFYTMCCVTGLEYQFQEGSEHERTSVSKRKPGVPRRTGLIAQRRTGAGRQSQSGGAETPQPPSRRAVERGLRLPVRQRWEVGQR